MGKGEYYHQRFFRVLYKDMERRINQYRSIRSIENVEEKRERMEKFLEEQRIIIRKFIHQEKRIRGVLKKGLKSQQRDIEGLWKKHVAFRKVKRNCMTRFDNLIYFAQQIKKILDEGNFDERDSRILFSDIEDELRTIVHLSDDYQVRRYSQGVLEWARRNRNAVALTMLFLTMSSISVYVLTNSHIMMFDTQTTHVGFVEDNMHEDDWAAGAHYSYGFHTMLDRIVHHKSSLSGLDYDAIEDHRYGNPDANVLRINGGAAKLLPGFMGEALGDNIYMEVAALNKGEAEVKIKQDGENGAVILNVLFHQDQSENIGVNSRGFSKAQLLEMYHSIRLGIEHRVNTN